MHSYFIEKNVNTSRFVEISYRPEEIKYTFLYFSTFYIPPFLSQEIENISAVYTYHRRGISNVCKGEFGEFYVFLRVTYEGKVL